MSNVLTAFTIFLKLPTELRLKIWQFTFRHPRIIEFRPKSRSNQIRKVPFPYNNGRTVSELDWLTKCPPQPGISVCRESRQEALKFWTVRFPLRAGSDWVIYMNLHQDIVFLPDLYNAHLELVGDIYAYDTTDCGVRLLAMDLHNVLNMDRWNELKTKLPLMAPALEWLYLVIDDTLGGIHGRKWEPDCTFVAPRTDHEKMMSMKVGDPSFEATRQFWKDRADVPEVRIVALRTGEAARQSIESSS